MCLYRALRAFHVSTAILRNIGAKYIQYSSQNIILSRKTNLLSHLVDLREHFARSHRSSTFSRFLNCQNYCKTLDCIMTTANLVLWNVWNQTSYQYDLMFGREIMWGASFQAKMLGLQVLWQLPTKNIRNRRADRKSDPKLFISPKRGSPRQTWAKCCICKRKGSSIAVDCTTNTLINGPGLGLHLDKNKRSEKSWET